MKYVGWTVIVMTCFLIGFIAYVPLAPALLKEEGGKEADGGDLVEEVTLSGPGGEMRIEVNFAAVGPDELPGTVTLKKRVEVHTEGQESIVLEAGTKARVKALEDGILTVAPLIGPMEGKTKARATDLSLQIARARVRKRPGTPVAKIDQAPPPGTPARAAKPAAAPDAPEPAVTGATVVNDPPKPGPVRPREEAPAGKPKGEEPKEDVYARQAAALYPMPKIKPLMEIVQHWAAVPRNAYPDEVAVKAPLDFQQFRDGELVGRGTLAAGSLVVPLELVGETLKVSSGSGEFMEASVPVDETDFKERVAARYERFRKERTALVHARRATERERLAKAASLEESLQSYNEGTDPRFDALRESLRQGDAGFYQLDAASKWRWAGKETIDGVEYEIGFVMMASESAFGVTEREVKALIRDGKVEKWIDVASNQEL